MKDKAGKNWWWLTVICWGVLVVHYASGCAQLKKLETTKAIKKSVGKLDSRVARRIEREDFKRDVAEKCEELKLAEQTLRKPNKKGLIARWLVKDSPEEIEYKNVKSLQRKFKCDRF